MTTATEAVAFPGEAAAGPRRAPRLSSQEIVHDLRQPLAVVSALVTVAERQSGVPLTVRRCLAQMKDELEELSKFCRRIAAEEPIRARVAVHHLASSVAEAAALATARAVTVTAADAFVHGNEVDLRRAVLNLLENACRATAPDGEVSLRVTATPYNVRIEVHDSGPGFGLGASGSSSLGLRIVEVVAAEHAGHVEISASDLGGAAVTLVLPSDSAANGEHEHRVRPATATRSAHGKDGRCAS